MAERLLEVRDLTVNLKLPGGREVTAVDGVSFTVDRNEILCIVGESGCGKTLAASAVMGLLPPRTGRLARGQVLFEGEDLAAKTPREMCAVRGQKISMIFQDPLSSLNPVYRIETQMREALRAHRTVSRREAREISAGMLRKVGIAMPEARLRCFPHQLSGGQIQRVMTAMALLSNPSLLIADEPTSALDVTIQAQILDLIGKMRRETGISVLLITHDMGLAAGNADKVMVMYAGKVMESGTAEEIFTRPLHPYTQGLLAAIPGLDAEMEDLPFIAGVVPTLDAMPRGCRFSTRCPYAEDCCREEAPPLTERGTRRVFCHRAGKRLAQENIRRSPDAMAPG